MCRKGPYWITLRRNKTERLGFSAKTAEQTIASVDRMQAEGWDEVRIIDPNGDEVSLFALQRAVESLEVDAL